MNGLVQSQNSDSIGKLWILHTASSHFFNFLEQLVQAFTTQV